MVDMVRAVSCGCVGAFKTLIRVISQCSSIAVVVHMYARPRYGSCVPVPVAATPGLAHRVSRPTLLAIGAVYTHTPQYTFAYTVHREQKDHGTF